MGEKISGLFMPAMFIAAWIVALTGSKAPGAVVGESNDISYLRWILFFAAIGFLISAFMHTVMAKKIAASIGWTSNGFQYEVAFVSLGIGLAALYSLNNGENLKDTDAMVAVSIVIISFLFLAGVNHVIEMVRKKNFAPNNSLILIYDFGISISLAALMASAGIFPSL